ncbi:hypothetical protein PR202_gb09115 [Eleusine coracana subsp. coracana]|uniref:Uncharacterized protein n=1 Tax=Eleusine coracana subsp. coracana TaxID=191504 RepID=A0AAV5EGK3_ELECO|nr:hypothetical protein PR202_gb09115 [Eleusine coracana subsp. coracana]
MDYNEAYKEWRACEKYEVGKTTEEDKASCFSELEEGEFKKDEPSVSKSLVRKDMDTRTIKFDSSAQVTVERVQVNARQSVPLERGTNGGGTAKATVEESDCSPLEVQPVNLRWPTFHRKYAEKHRRSYSPSFHISSKERQKQRKCNCFSCKYYHDVLKKIEKVCSERLSELVLQHSEDRKEFNILLKKQKLEFFREHLHSYKVQYERVIPTVSYERIKLPKLFVCTLRKIFHKHTQHQLIQFVKRQINDRNKEKRMKDRWIFEAKAGYLKKYFAETSLTYSGFEMGKSKLHMHDYSDGEQQFKYLEMQSLCSAIEAVASSNELADYHTSKNIDVSDIQSPLGTNGNTKHKLSVVAADEIATIDSMPSQSNCAPAVEFGEKVVTQVTFLSPPQNMRESVVRSFSSIEYLDETLEIAKEMSTDSGNTLRVPREKRRRTSTSAGDDASEGSCSRSQRKFSQEFVPNFHETSLCHEVLARFKLKAGINANLSTTTQRLTEMQHRDQNGPNASYPYQRSDGSTCSVRTGLDSPGPETSNVEQQPTNQMMARSIVEQCTPEVRCQSDPTTIQLNQVPMPCSDHSSSFSQAMEQRNINICSSSLTQRVTQHPYHNQTRQPVGHQYESSGGNTTPVRLDSPGQSNVQRQSANQTTTGSTSEHMLESGLPSDPFTIELSRLRMLRDLMTKRHQYEKQKINLERGMEEAELKKKYDELFHNLEMETLQKKKDIQIIQEKVCKQQILAEAFQVVQASAEVVSCNQRAAPLTIDEPNQSSGQQTVWFPASATMHQPPQPAARSSTHQFLRQSSMSTQGGANNTLGGSAATLMSAPRGVVGTRIAYYAPAHHLRTFLNQLPASRHGATSLER